MGRVSARPAGRPDPFFQAPWRRAGADARPGAARGHLLGLDRRRQVPALPGQGQGPHHHLAAGRPGRFFRRRGHRDHRLLVLPQGAPGGGEELHSAAAAAAKPWPETSSSPGKRPGASPPWISARRCASRGGRWSPSRPWKAPTAPSSGRRRSPAPGWSWPRSAGRARTCASTCRWWGSGPWRCWPRAGRRRSSWRRAKR